MNSKKIIKNKILAESLNFDYDAYVSKDQNHFIKIKTTYGNVKNLLYLGIYNTFASGIPS